MPDVPPATQPPRTAWPGVIGVMCVAWGAINVLGNFIALPTTNWDYTYEYGFQLTTVSLWIRVLGPLATLGLSLYAIYVGILLQARRHEAAVHATMLAGLVLIYMPLCLALLTAGLDWRTLFLTVTPALRIAYATAGLLAAIVSGALGPAFLLLWFSLSRVRQEVARWP